MHDALQTPPLHEAALLLGFALACVLLFRKLGLGATLGYLLAGALVGPHVLGWVGDADGKIDIAELGIAFLLFIVGLELNPARLWQMKGEIFGLGLLQVAVGGAVLIALVMVGTNGPLPVALALGLPLALSSTAQVLPMLQSAGRLQTPFGQRAFAILLFQDLSIIPLITLIAAMSGGAQASRPGWQLALITLAAIAGLILAGRYLIRPLFGLISNLGERELFVVAALFTIIASAAVMEILGLSIALGAFVAGVMLADSPYRHELEADVEPFRSILLGLFFLAVGMMLDLGAIAARPLFVFSMALALIAAKAAILFLIGIVFRMPWRSALALGLLLSQGGEFGFVLFAQARDAGLIGAETTSLFSAIVTLSMISTPFLMTLTRKIRRQPVPMQVRDGPRAGRRPRHCRGLWPLRPDGLADAHGGRRQRHHDRHRHRADRHGRGVRRQGLFRRRHAHRSASSGGWHGRAAHHVLPGRRHADLRPARCDPGRISRGRHLCPGLRPDQRDPPARQPGKGRGARDHGVGHRHGARGASTGSTSASTTSSGQSASIAPTTVSGWTPSSTAATSGPDGSASSPSRTPGRTRRRPAKTPLRRLVLHSED